LHKKYKNDTVIIALATSATYKHEKGKIAKVVGNIKTVGQHQQGTATALLRENGYSADGRPAGEFAEARQFDALPRDTFFWERPKG